MIKLIKPYISFDEVEEGFRDIFESGWFSKGKFVQKFRDEIAIYTNAKYSHLTTSATTALSISLRALDIRCGDEVIVSDFSFPATSNVVEDLGATPIFADVSKESYNMLPDELERKITPKTKAVIFVDALGNPTGLHTIKDICKKHNIPLIEDGACALGSSEDGKMCGEISDITCFSFHPRKLLTTGEGGAITFNSDRFAEFFDIKLNHGAKIENGKFEFIDFGYNFRLSELQALMGLIQIKKLDSIVESRNRIRDEYLKRLEPLGFRAQRRGDNVVHNVQSLVFVVPKNINRDELIKFLREKGVETTLGTYALSATAYNRRRYNQIQPNSLYLQENTITFPCYDGVDIEYIVDIIKGYMR
jgi:dTDP-4-amino-4,6-dideoxygalactose transaminase